MLRRRITNTLRKLTTLLTKIAKESELVSVPAGRAIRWWARWATGTTGGTGAAGATRTKRGIFPAPKVGHHFAGFFGFTFRTYRICFFIHAYGDNFKLFSTLIAFIFIYRHNFISLMFFFQSKD